MLTWHSNQCSLYEMVTKIGWLLLLLLPLPDLPFDEGEAAAAADRDEILLKIQGCQLIAKVIQISSLKNVMI